MHLHCFNKVKIVTIYALLVCKIFGLKIRSCKFFDKSQVMPMYIEKTSGDLVGGHHSGQQRRTRKDRATQPMDHGVVVVVVVVVGGSGWYLVVLGQYNLVLLGIKWYWVSIGLLCLYILKKMEI